MDRQELDDSNVASTMCSTSFCDGDCKQCKNDMNAYKPSYPDGGAIDLATLLRNYTPREIEDFIERATPKEPHYTNLEYLVNGLVFKVQQPECPRCYKNGLSLWDRAIPRWQKYCVRCGQAVKWE